MLMCHDSFSTTHFTVHIKLLKEIQIYDINKLFYLFKTLNNFLSNDYDHDHKSY